MTKSYQVTSIGIMGNVVEIEYEFNGNCLWWKLKFNDVNSEHEQLLSHFLKLYCTPQIESFLRNERHLEDYFHSHMVYPENGGIPF